MGRRRRGRSSAGEKTIVATESYLDWVMPALPDAGRGQSSTSCPQGETCWKIRTFEANQQKVVEKEKVFNNLENWLESLADMPPVEELWTKEAVSGENRTLRKTSVTRIIRHAENSLPGGKTGGDDGRQKDSGEIPEGLAPV